jgi:Transglutaminase-like superfamily
MSRVGKFLALSRSERRLVVRAWLMLAVLRAGVWTLPFGVVTNLVEFIGVRDARLAERMRPSPERIAWAVAAASRLVPRGGNCLVRALATQALLGRFGYPGELRIGVAKTEQGGLRAHAWLESGGRVVIGDLELSSYAPLGAAASVGAHRPDITS